MALKITVSTCDLKLLYAVSWLDPLSRRLFKAEAQVLSKTSPCGVCEGKVKLGKVSFCEYFSFL